MGLLDVAASYFFLEEMRSFRRVVVGMV